MTDMDRQTDERQIDPEKKIQMEKMSGNIAAKLKVVRP